MSHACVHWILQAEPYDSWVAEAYDSSGMQVVYWARKADAFIIQVFSGLTK
ncbi:hypothetical protein L914_20938 [Phytophthora nicotianae]|uniref:Uncharacterized protein n=1 Tax=Phytophthora nicotianae TaxID=4792 RepID=W2HSW2_PHYNI|nr:hypothetical protein L916_21066 [Phytophthora nicotianae]ETM31506.1 hypothetical protein L914_20938 [Phytophthora nicotianae]